MQKDMYLGKNFLKEIKNSHFIKIDNEEINIELISNIVNDKQMFLKLYNILKNKNQLIIKIFDEENNCILRQKKIIIIKSIFILIKRGIIFINQYNNDKLCELQNLYSLNSLFSNNIIHNFFADYNEYFIPINFYLDFLTLDHNNFSLFFTDNRKYHNIDKRYFVYGLIKYLEDNNILDNYLLPEYVLVRIKKIKNMEYIDYESINKILNTDDQIHQNILINQDLEKELLKDKDKFSNDLVFLIQVYLKMCLIFTYDSSFYVNNRGGYLNEKHQNIDNLKNISIDNNEIVCYEFTAIFTYILKFCHINYILKQKSDSYGQCHNYIIFRYQEYLIKVDSIMAIFESDLTNVKIKDQINGLVCLNKNIDIKHKFLNLINTVYKLQSQDMNNFFQINNLDDLIKAFSLIIKKINSLDLPILDAYSYFYKLKAKYIFKKNNYQVDIIKKNFVNKYSKPIIVIALNEISIYEPNNLYFIYDYPKFKIIDKEELENKFIQGEYQYLNDSLIPGLHNKYLK